MGNWREINSEYVHPAQNALRRGDYRRALEIIREGYEEYPHDGYILMNYGEVLEKSGNYQESLKMYEEAYENLPLQDYKDKAMDGIRRVKRHLRDRKDSEEKLSVSESEVGEMKIGLISCTEKKKQYCCPAEDLYSGSNFPRHLKTCKEKYNKFFIISAKFGLVEPEQSLGPYDLNLADLNDEEKFIWAKFILARLRLVLNGTDMKKVRLIVHASETYWIPLEKACREKGIKCEHVSWE